MTSNPCQEGCTCGKHRKWAQDKICAIYAILNTETGDTYIGSSRDVMTRIRWHRCLIKNRNHPCRKIRQASEEFESNVFVFVILEICEPNKRLDQETVWLKSYQPKYNSVHEGHQSDAARILMLGNKVGIGNTNLLGHKHSTETKNKMSMSQRRRYAYIER